MKRGKKTQYDIFISYRREHGAETAKHLRDVLVGKGYRVFFDTDSLRNGNFDTALFDVIRRCKDFIIILQPGSLDRCVNEGDWVRMELACALKSGKNVIPILGNDFRFPETLPDDIKDVRYRNGVNVVMMYFDAAVEKLETFLESTPVIRQRKRLLLIAAAASAVLICAAVLLIPRNGSFTENPPAASAVENAAQAPAVSPAGASEESPSAGDEVNSPAASSSDESEAQTVSMLKEEFFDKNAWDKAAEWPVLGSNVTRREIRSVTFLQTLEGAPDNAWDVSRDGDRSCLAWTTGNPGNYSLFVAGEGTIRAPESLSGFFCGYEHASAIVFGDILDTSEVRSLSCLFMGCSELKSLDLGGFDTSAATDGSYMFFGCTQLEDLNVTSFDTSEMTSLEAMFFGCGSLKTLDVTGFNTARAKDMNNMFAGCQRLEKLDLEGFDTSSAVNLEAMFFNCSGLKSLDPGSFDTSSSVNMSKMFYSCRALEELDLDAFDFSAAVDMREMFAECAGLTSLKLGILPAESEAQMDGIFTGCASLLNVSLAGQEDSLAVSRLRNELPESAALHVDSPE